MRIIYLVCMLGLASNALASVDVKWEQFKGIDQGEYCTTTEDDPWMISSPFDTPPADHHYLLVEMSVSKPVNVELRWLNDDDRFDGNCMLSFSINQINTPVLKVVDLDRFGGFHSLNMFRLDPGNGAGVKFRIQGMEFVPVEKVPSELFAELIEFRGYTSKLHYLPGELIEYRSTLLSRNYPVRHSAKLLTANIVNSEGQVVASHFQQYALPEVSRMKELYGVIKPNADLKPGKYRLETVSRDLLTGLELRASHAFGILSDADPFIYETPFKFVKDFSIIRDQEGLWHIFSITGDFFEGHDWQPDGNERTFSHGTSRDLRHWEYHPPVLSISENDYPDGNGKYEDRNIWAPHVIHHKGTYYMFYTSVNKQVSQSISLVTSKDLFNWKKHDKNPVVTLEGAEWASWRRDGWADFRDPAILKDGDTFYMYCTVYAKDGRGTVSVCKSRDLFNWTTPTIAAVGKPAMESPMVWKKGGHYYMTTSSTGAGVWTSDRPDTGWVEVDFPRPPVQTLEKYVPTSVSYAEEVVPFDDESQLMASITWRLWGNSIYLSKIISDKEGQPIRYESPFMIGISE